MSFYFIDCDCIAHLVCDYVNVTDLFEFSDEEFGVVERYCKVINGYNCWFIDSGLFFEFLKHLRVLNFPYSFIWLGGRSYGKKD